MRVCMCVSGARVILRAAPHTGKEITHRAERALGHAAALALFIHLFLAQRAVAAVALLHARVAAAVQRLPARVAALGQRRVALQVVLRRAPQGSAAGK